MLLMTYLTRLFMLDQFTWAAIRLSSILFMILMRDGYLLRLRDVLGVKVLFMIIQLLQTGLMLILEFIKI